MNFIAIDFETANNYRRSACSLGLVVVENGTIAEERYWEIKPNPFEVGFWQHRVHGLGIEQLRDRPTFDQLWAEVEPYLLKYPVFAHNAAFDLSVLRHVCSHYDLNLNLFSEHCTLKLSRMYWPGELTYSLGYLAHKYGIALRHHHAGEDARACAQLALLLAQQSAATTAEVLEEAAWALERSRRQSERRAERQGIPIHLSNEPDPTHLFFDKEVVFTGTLAGMSREVAQQLVERVGGRAGESLKRSTNYLVIGHQTSPLVSSDLKSGKMKKADEMIAKGLPIEIIDEAYFFQLMC